MPLGVKRLVSKKHPGKLVKVYRISIILVPRKGLEPPRSYSLVPETKVGV